MKSAVVRTRRFTLISVAVIGRSSGMGTGASARSGWTRRSAARIGGGDRLRRCRSRRPCPGDRRSGRRYRFQHASIPFPTLCPTPWTRSSTRRPTRSKTSQVPPPGSLTPSPTPHPGPWMRSPARPRTSSAAWRTPSGRPAQARVRPCRQERLWGGSRVRPRPDLPSGIEPAQRRRPGPWSPAPPAERPSWRHGKGRIRPPASARHPASRSHRRRARRRARLARTPWPERSPTSSGSCWPSPAGERSPGSSRHSCSRSSG